MKKVLVVLALALAPASAASADTWTFGPSLGMSRAFPATASLADGSVLAIGGQDASSASLATVERYDPASASTRKIRLKPSKKLVGRAHKFTVGLR